MAGKATKIAAGVVAVVILVNIMLALVYIASISEPARSVIMNVATDIAICCTRNCRKRSGITAMTTQCTAVRLPAENYVVGKGKLANRN